jgi:K(+)-stimulated pyrophosphate-energized sodium pump
MGMLVVGLGLLGMGVLFVVLNAMYPAAATEQQAMLRVLNLLSGFSLGASSIALFARVGGGIYTKAADVGADLVGKVERASPRITR